MSIWEDRADKLFDILADRIGQVTTWEDIAAETGWERWQVGKTVQKLRDILGENDVLSVTSDPQGQYEPWSYQLIGGNQMISVNDRGWSWLINRFSDTERRLKTILHVLDAIVRATDGRTTLGQKARIYQLHIARAREEVQLLDNENGLTN